MLLPGRGIYAGRALLGDGAFAAAIDVGTNPTFGWELLHVEAYLLDYEGELAGAQIRLEFWERRLWALAHAHNLLYAPHTGFSGGIAHLASLHLAAAAPNFYTYEYMGTSYIQNPLRDIFTAPFPAPKEGLIALPQGPGLGLEIDPALVRRYAVR